jgi:hypothetical protein
VKPELDPLPKSDDVVLVVAVVVIDGITLGNGNPAVLVEVTGCENEVVLGTGVKLNEVMLPVAVVVIVVIGAAVVVVVAAAVDVNVPSEEVEPKK